MHLKTKPSTYKTNARGHLTKKQGPGNIQQGEGDCLTTKARNTKWKGNKRAEDAPENKALHTEKSG